MKTIKEQMNIVIVGHVDHGKSTFIGRLLADTGSLPEGKLEQVKATCAANARPFEYAFLLDALKDEQAQGITIDTARSFFETKKRHYIIIDAPGHIEFLKNMVTGAARAEAALLLIDAKEGVRENSRRHGYLLSMLGIKQVVVLVNKMDLVNYDEDTFNNIVKEYSSFLKEINVEPKGFVPISAFNGENIIEESTEMSWYKGFPVLDFIDNFSKEEEKKDKVLRWPIQDIYKFTNTNDDRRIVAGTIETGSVSVGDEVVFYPSGKASKIKRIEGFNTESKTTVSAGEAIGVTLETQIYIKPGELMVKKEDSSINTGTLFRANIFWLGKKPMIKGKKYKLKLAASRTFMYIKEIVKVIDASNLSTSSTKTQIDRHDVAECVFQTVKPIAFDLSSEIEATGRIVIVDDYEISGGGIVTEYIEDGSRLDDYLKERQFSWERTNISAAERAMKLNQTPQFVLITGSKETGEIELAKAVETALFNEGKNVYYLGVSNLLAGLASDISGGIEDKDEHIRRLGETAHLFTEAGLIFISTISDLDDYEVTILKELIKPNGIVVINVGENRFNSTHVDADLDHELPFQEKVEKVIQLLLHRSVVSNYSI
jgi:bifunctional enzyme CysN/CysC